MAPSTPEGLEFVNCTYQSPFGQIISNWKKEPSGSYRYEMTIPEGSIANVTLPPVDSQKVVMITSDKLEITEIENLESGKFKLKGGKYSIEVWTDKE